MGPLGGSRARHDAKDLFRACTFPGPKGMSMQLPFQKASGVTRAGQQCLRRPRRGPGGTNRADAAGGPRREPGGGGGGGNLLRGYFSQSFSISDVCRPGRRWERAQKSEARAVPWGLLAPRLWPRARAAWASVPLLGRRGVTASWTVPPGLPRLFRSTQSFTPWPPGVGRVGRKGFLSLLRK